MGTAVGMGSTARINSRATSRSPRAAAAWSGVSPPSSRRLGSPLPENSTTHPLPPCERRQRCVRLLMLTAGVPLTYMLFLTRVSYCGDLGIRRSMALHAQSSSPAQQPDTLSVGQGEASGRTRSAVTAEPWRRRRGRALRTAHGCMRCAAPSGVACVPCTPPVHSPPHTCGNRRDLSQVSLREPSRWLTSSRDGHCESGGCTWRDRGRKVAAGA